MKCDYRDKMPLGCMNGKAEYKLTIRYNEFDSDALSVCKECAGRISVDARRHGYNTGKWRL